MTAPTLAEAVARFGAALKPKLSSPAATGAPEDQLRAPLETLLADLAHLLLFKPGQVVAIGETTLAALHTRPDYAVTAHGALVGFIEVKAPGKGADPRRFTDPHDRAQWAKLKSLPNLLYTDGNAFSLWRGGHLHEIVHLEGNVETAGPALRAPPALERLFAGFLRWEPITPATPRALAEIGAALCRLLRDEVTEQLAALTPALTGLATDWRKLLFPEATDAEFADGYAQAVTFGLLMARAQGIPLTDFPAVARALARTNTVIGGAFRVLTDDVDGQAALKTSLGTLTRVLGAVDWAVIGKGDPDAWLYFYEHFLEAYDNDLRKLTGSYYTPPEVVTAMVRLTDETLQDPTRFAVPGGLASPEVTLADPALGTGTYLLGVLRRIAATTRDDQGQGAVPAAIRAALPRLIGFELQFGPFAVAQLRLVAEVAQLLQIKGTIPEDIRLRLYVTDTLGNPYVEDEYLPQILKSVAESRRQANAIKRQEPITVVIGNPPYKEKAKGRGGWIESGPAVAGIDATPLDKWMPPPDWGVGAHAKHLRNLYVYFWRWAAWKVFGDADPSPQAPARRGVVCFITVAGFLNGPGFQAMRADLRRTVDQVHVIDCSPEGHQPPVNSRVFQGVQQPVCIVLAARTAHHDPAIPARVRYHALPTGRREAKFDALAALTLDGPTWTDCPTDWRAPFLPAPSGGWATYPTLDALFDYNGSGVMPGRTWVIAPDKQSLSNRWNRLVAEKDAPKKAVLFHPHIRKGEAGDKHVDKLVTDGLAGHEHRSMNVAKDAGVAITPVRYGFRSFDRQWIIPDSRLLNQPNPSLWTTHSVRQVYLTALMAHSPTSGPAVTFTALIPDMHHYKGSFGGRAFPLWANPAATQPNIRPALLAWLAETYATPVTPEDLLAYIAAVAAHPAYTARFAPNLVQPGLRIPLTANPALFAEAVALGREIIWLHTFGERFSDPAAARPAAPPRLLPGERPTIPEDAPIPSTPDAMPRTLRYDPAAQALHVGAGRIDRVPPETWAYQVSGKHVLTQWFSYRGQDRTRPIIGICARRCAAMCAWILAARARFTNSLICSHAMQCHAMPPSCHHRV